MDLCEGVLSRLLADGKHWKYEPVHIAGGIMATDCTVISYGMVVILSRTLLPRSCGTVTETPLQGFWYSPLPGLKIPWPSFSF